ncbi:hypothetical protein ACK31Z_12430 [Aeromonas dhakensis]|uniref:hypothetical protein n=1 Tax=Aeromonas dhakensis TaxID=196024 RepID=UPI001C5AF151|nr:hypothetical protein [Aeromonas dhakensis]MBW3691621.1 hypothetical protein [Aeromonas dhakensis]MDH0174281.1 hypothetical protein [Aeromonas dhakensis]MDX7833433.1 hypothetical protein [Aeromonas dhakensis]
MSGTSFEFKDTLSYTAPAAPDCLMVPEVQWDELQSNLSKIRPFRDNLLWVFCGIFGGGAVSCWATFFTFSTETPENIKNYFFNAGIILPIATLICIVLALKLGSNVTADNVKGQMEVLKKGFRKLTTAS